MRPFGRTRLFSGRAKMRMAAEPLVARGDGRDESIAQFIGRRFGDEAVTYLAEPLLAGIHAGDVDRLSMAALFPRMVQMERERGSLIRGFRRPQPVARSIQGRDHSVFMSLPGGLS